MKKQLLIPLFTRVSPKNAQFINKLSKKAGVSRTEFLEKHFDFLRNNVQNLKLLNVQKTGNKVQGEGGSST